MSVLDEPVAGPSNAPAQLAVRLITRSQHHIPETRFFVPSEWKRFQLSELINKVLEYEKPVPFDFIIEGELLRTSLAAYVKQKGLTEESVLELEYVESILPPEYVSAFEHQDWVSDIDMRRPGVFLSACYDGTATVFSSSGQRQASIIGHAQPVLSACWVNMSGGEGEELIATGGMDRIIRVTKLSAAPREVETAQQRSATWAFSLPLHSQPVASVRSSSLPSAYPRLLSSGWDGQVALWSLDASSNTDVENGDVSRSRKKRRKVDSTNDAPRLAPVHVLRGHNGQVTRAIFDRVDAGRAYSSGWDHSVRSWDLEIGGQSSAKAAADKVLLDLDQMASTNLLITGSTDRTVCFWDSRQDSSTISLTLQGHSAPVSSVRAHPTSAVLALSTGYDGMLRVWDARSSKQALFAVRRQPNKSDAGRLENKILCADWDEKGSLIGVGGEDGRVELHRVSARLGDQP